jgi:Ser/Thr protein kinase RdoA (MazF antagonist)
MTDKRAAVEIPTNVLNAWKFLHHCTITPLGTGLINDTFLAQSSDQHRVVLQRVHRNFGPSVNDDIYAVTEHLLRKDLCTPTLVRTDDGQLCVSEQDRTWRVLSYVHGEALDKVDHPSRAQQAGRLVAQWHRTLSDFAYQYVHVRVGVHDTPRHLKTLELAVAEHKQHPLRDQVAPIAEQLLRAGQALEPLAHMRSVHAHGDLKLSNLLFEHHSQRGLCLVDLDTLTKMPWVWEMGDALRSWCNPLGENVTSARVDRDILRAAMVGYAQGASDTANNDSPLVNAQERERLVDGLATIALELSARFLADALNEQYFGWDNRRYATRGEHNLVRAQGQWSLAQDVLGSREELRELIVKTLSAPM